MKVLIVSVRLGKINRGFETFANELFLALEKEGVDVYISQAKTTDNSKRRIIIPHYTPGKKIKHFLSKISNRLGSEGFIEEVSFALFLYYQIKKLSPDIVYVMEINLANTINFLKSKLNGKFEIMFSNGAPYTPDYFINKNYFIQQHLQWTYQNAIEFGLPKNQLNYIPYGFNIERAEHVDEDTTLLKQKLGIHDDKKILLTVCALNKYHKRVDYIIDECMPLLKSGNYRLICLGQFEEETKEIMNSYSHLITDGSLIIKSVNYRLVKEYYKIADLFLLGSLQEGFGRVIVEAMSYGLTCVLHDFNGFREIGGEYAFYLNMRNKSELNLFLEMNNIKFEKSEIIRHVYNRYDWSVLIPFYIKNFESILSN